MEAGVGALQLRPDLVSETGLDNNLADRLNEPTSDEPAFTRQQPRAALISKARSLERWLLGGDGSTPLG